LLEQEMGIFMRFNVILLKERNKSMIKLILKREWVVVIMKFLDRLNSLQLIIEFSIYQKEDTSVSGVWKPYH